MMKKMSPLLSTAAVADAEKGKGSKRMNDDDQGCQEKV
jgi:hypothetical protein